MFKLGLEKTEGPEITLATSVGPSKKVREFQKKSERNPAFDCVDHNKLENSKRDGNTRPL